MLCLGIMYLISVEKEYIESVSYPIKYREYVEKYSEVYGLDKYLVYAFIRTESSFEPSAESSVGAIGLTQITEDTFDWIKGRLCPEEEIEFTDLYDPETSVRFGAYYIYRCMDRYGGNIETAAAAYHSGWTTVDTLLREQKSEFLVDFPYPQMKNYVHKISKAYEKYKEIYLEEKGA